MATELGFPFDLPIGLKLPFYLPDEAFLSSLDEEERWWVERERQSFSQNIMRGGTFDEEAAVAVERVIVGEGVYKAAAAKYNREQDYEGAEKSWVKWIGLCNDPLLLSRSKEKWLLLANIYVGKRDARRATQALAWAKALHADESPLPGITSQQLRQLKALWDAKVAEVENEIKRLPGSLER